MNDLDKWRENVYNGWERRKITRRIRYDVPKFWTMEFIGCAGILILTWMILFLGGN